MRQAFDRLRAHAPAMARTTADGRRERLARLARAIAERRGAIAHAIHRDFARPDFETEIAETQHALAEIAHARRHLKRWMKGEHAPTELLLLGTRGRIRYEPRGVVLVMAPWNYPFELLMGPLIAAIAAGNVVMVKPSEKTPHIAAVIAELVASACAPDEVACVTGGADVAGALLELPFDHIFFTGSPQIGKIVMAAAAKHLASVTLELGGKSPAIVDDRANITAAADRIVWGKFFNAGQTCIAPDYALVHRSREPAFLAAARAAVERFFGATEEARQQSPDLARIVDEGHFARVRGLIERSVAAGARPVAGARFDPATRYIAPTILSGVTPDMAVMGEEIFGPVLPVLAYDSLDEAVRLIRAGGKPLAMYVFAGREASDRLLEETSSGATIVGNTLLHYASHTLPFGGVGMSGQGSYHGVHGFRELSHARTVLHQWEPALARFFFPPYRGRMNALARWFIRTVGVLALFAAASCGRAAWREADQRLNDAAQAARAAGFKPLAGPNNTFGIFTAGGESEWRVHLEAHEPYFIGAACTSGCDSIAFVVREPHGTVIGADTSSGPIGRLALTAPEEGEFRILVAHGGCAAPQCRWIAQVYGSTR